MHNTFTSSHCFRFLRLICAFFITRFQLRNKETFSRKSQFLRKGRKNGPKIVMIGSENVPESVMLHCVMNVKQKIGAIG